MSYMSKEVELLLAFCNINSIDLVSLPASNVLSAVMIKSNCLVFETIQYLAAGVIGNLIFI